MGWWGKGQVSVGGATREGPFLSFESLRTNGSRDQGLRGAETTSGRTGAETKGCGARRPPQDEREQRPRAAGRGDHLRTNGSRDQGLRGAETTSGRTGAETKGCGARRPPQDEREQRPRVAGRRAVASYCRLTRPRRCVTMLHTHPRLTGGRYGQGAIGNAGRRPGPLR